MISSISIFTPTPISIFISLSPSHIYGNNIYKIKMGNKCVNRNKIEHQTYESVPESNFKYASENKSTTKSNFQYTLDELYLKIWYEEVSRILKTDRIGCEITDYYPCQWNKIVDLDNLNKEDESDHEYNYKNYKKRTKIIWNGRIHIGNIGCITGDVFWHCIGNSYFYITNQPFVNGNPHVRILEPILYSSNFVYRNFDLHFSRRHIVAIDFTDGHKFLNAYIGSKYMPVFVSEKLSGMCKSHIRNILLLTNLSCDVLDNIILRFLFPLICDIN